MKRQKDKSNVSQTTNSKEKKNSVITIVAFFVISSGATALLNKFWNAIFPENVFDNFLNRTVHIKWFITILLVELIVFGCSVYIRDHFIIKSNNNAAQNEQKRKDRLELALAKLNGLLELDDFNYIDGLQIYQYSQNNDSNGWHITLSFVDGAIRKGVDINAIEKAHFDFSHKKGKRIVSIKNEYKKSLSNKSPHSMVVLNDKVLSFVDEIMAELSALQRCSDIKPYHYFLYAVVLCYSINFELSPSFEKLNDEVRTELIKGRRTGILGSIIIDSYYIFSNENSDTKNRIYFSAPINMDKHIVLVGTINMDMLTDEIDVHQLCEKYIETIMQEEIEL